MVRRTAVRGGRFDNHAKEPVGQQHPQQSEVAYAAKEGAEYRDALDVERTGRDTTVAQWGVASVVMVGSAASAGIGFTALGEHWAIGVITGLGVDLALASGLIIGRRLRAVGVTTYWGTVLQWLTAAMTLCLNSGAAALTGHWVLAVAHAFLPVLLVVLCEAGSEAQLKLLRLRQDKAAAEHAERVAQQREREQAELQRARGVLIDAEDYHRRAADLRRQGDRETAEAAQLRELAERERAPAEAAARAARNATQRLARAQQTRTVGGGSARNKPVTASREERREWVRQERDAGRNPTGAEVDHRFGPPRTGAAIVAEVDAERRRAAVHVVRNGG